MGEEHPFLPRLFFSLKKRKSQTLINLVCMMIQYIFLLFTVKYMFKVYSIKIYNFGIVWFKILF